MREFTDQEVEIVRELIANFGSDCPSLSCDELRPLAESLGVWQPEEPLTEEQIRRRDEFLNSPLGKMMSDMFARAAKASAERILEESAFSKFLSGEQWNGKVGSRLSIKLPVAYNVRSNA